MRTNIDIDDDLMRDALKAGGFETEKEAIEAGLRLIVKTGSQAHIRDLRGALKWEGSLDEMRRDK